MNVSRNAARLASRFILYRNGNCVGNRNSVDFLGQFTTMSVFVDDMFAAFGRMRMSHLIADSEDELLAMVDAIGVQRKWRQGTPGYDDHFDIAQSKRELAIAADAIPIPCSYDSVS